MSDFTIDDLARLIDERASSTAQGSYTKSLLDSGLARVAKKFGEEAIELIIAAAEREPTALTKEAADVFYHLLVLLKTAHVPLREVLNELGQRTAQSGHQEKASRPKA